MPGCAGGVMVRCADGEISKQNLTSNQDNYIDFCRNSLEKGGGVMNASLLLGRGGGVSLICPAF